MLLICSFPFAEMLSKCVKVKLSCGDNQDVCMRVQAVVHTNHSFIHSLGIVAHTKSKTWAKNLSKFKHFSRKCLVRIFHYSEETLESCGSPDLTIPQCRVWKHCIYNSTTTCDMTTYMLYHISD